MISTIRSMTEEIVEWADTVHPTRKPEETFKKMLKEIEELKHDIGHGDELADVMILLLDVCHLVDVDIYNEVAKKMLINRDRKWEIQDDGTLQHIQ